MSVPISESHRLNEATFEHGAVDLVRVFDSFKRDGHSESDCIHSEWSVRRHTRQGIYLVHERPIYVRLTKDSASHDPYMFEDETVMQDDTAIIVMSDESRNKDTVWMLSVVYSHTYTAPVLYFTVHHLDGTPCDRDDVVAWLQQTHQLNTMDLSWDIVSVDQHPMTAEPSFFLHPCSTKQWLYRMTDPCKDSPALSLLSWMAMVLSTLGQSIPAKVYEKVRTKLITQIHRKPE